MNREPHQRQIVFFKLTMWIVVICSLGSVAAKALVRNPSSAPLHYLLDSVPLHYLLGFAMVGALLAVLVPSLDSYVFSRVREVSFGGVKLELAAEARIAISELKYEERLASEVGSNAGLDYNIDEPFPTPKLTGPKRYHYERLSQKLYRIWDQIEDPNQLDAKSRENYRELLKNVGRAAFAMKHFTKYFEIVWHLEALRDRELNSDESFLIGNAYLWAADELPGDPEREDYFRKALPFLRAAMKENPDEAKFPYNLGWALLNLKQYQDGVDLMEISIQKRPSIAPWAKWNIACGLKRLNEDTKALNKLSEIPPGIWWEGIAKDDWFVDAGNTTFTTAFEELWQRKRAEVKANQP